MFKHLLWRELECGKRKQWWSKKALLGHPKGRIDWVQPSGKIFWVLCQKDTATDHQGEGRHRPLWTKADAVGQDKHVGGGKQILSATAAAIDHSMQIVSGMVTSMIKSSYPSQASTSFSLHPLSLTHPSTEQDCLSSLGGTNSKFHTHKKYLGWDILVWVFFLSLWYWRHIQKNIKTKWTQKSKILFNKLIMKTQAFYFYSSYFFL